MKYSVGCGLFGIYAGILKPNGKEWKEKTDVTMEAMKAVAQYLLDNQKEFHLMNFSKLYSMKIL